MKRKLKIGQIKFVPSNTNPDGKLALVQGINLSTMSFFTRKLSNFYRQGSIGEKVEYDGKIVVITGVKYEDGINYYTIADVDNLNKTKEVTEVKFKSKKAPIKEGELWYIEEVGDYIHLIKKSKSQKVREKFEKRDKSLRIACLEEFPHLSFVSEEDVVLASGESIPLYTILANANKVKNTNFARKRK